MEGPRRRASTDTLSAGIQMDSSVLTAHCGPKVQSSHSSWPIDKAPGTVITSLPRCSSGLVSSPVEVPLPQSLGADEVTIPESIWQSQLIPNAQGNTAPKSVGVAFATKAKQLSKADQLSKAIESRVEQCVNRTGTWEDVQKVIKNSVLGLLRDTSEGSPAEAVSPTTCGLKTKLVACDECDKTVHRHCDLRYS